VRVDGHLRGYVSGMVDGEFSGVIHGDVDVALTNNVQIEEQKEDQPQTSDGEGGTADEDEK